MDIKLYHGGVKGNSRHSIVFATPVRRIAEGYAIFSCYSHREMGTKTRAVVETGTGIIGRPDEAHALSYLMYEWNVLSTDVVEVAPTPPGAVIYITSFCDDTKCQRCGTAITVRPGVAETRLAFIYCLCDKAESPRLDKEYAEGQAG